MFSEQTQEQNNRLPQFHAGRRKRDSNWASIVNAIDGATLEDFNVQAARAFRNQFLRTVHLDEPDLLRVVDLPQGVDLTPRQTNFNILRNSSFELRSRPDKVADWWEHTGTVAVSSPALFGGVTPSLTPAASETASIQQEVKTDPWNIGESRTFSAWYRIASWAGGTLHAARHGLIVTVTYGDGSTQDFRTAFASDTNDEWRRLTLTVTPTKAVAFFTLKFETIRSGIFNIDVPIYIDAVQAEEGTTATVWRPNLFDGPHWFASTFFTPVNFDGPTPIFVTDSLRDFFYEAVPLRAELFDIRTLTSAADRRGGFGEAVDFHKLRWPYTWDVDTTNNKVRRIGLEPLDIYGLFDLSFFTGTSDGAKFEEDVSDLTYRCVAGFQRWIWVIHEMLDLNGVNRVMLSVVDPRVPFPAPDHYEAKYTLQLPLPVDLDYHSAQFRFEDPQHLYVATSSHEYVLRLFYDYAIIDELAFRVLFREKYDSLALVR
jgi:hypothetical protein